jgi:hypothetical protein
LFSVSSFDYDGRDLVVVERLAAEPVRERHAQAAVHAVERLLRDVEELAPRQERRRVAALHSLTTSSRASSANSVLASLAFFAFL